MQNNDLTTDFETQCSPSLCNSAALCAHLFEHTPLGILVTDADLKVVLSNPLISEMTAYTKEELLGQHLSLFEDTSLFSAEAIQHEIIEKKTPWEGECTWKGKDGRVFAVSLRVISFCQPQAAKAEIWLIWMVSDIGTSRATEKRLLYLARHDTLTGLPNRMMLGERLEQVLPQARRYGWLVAIMFIDLDRFKLINDTLGHQVGDGLLCEVANRLSDALRETDFVARLGGDEFVIVLPAISSPSDAAQVGARVIASLAAPIRIENHALHTSPSIGISIFPDDGQDTDTIMRNADAAMYHAKTAGRNNYQFFATSMNKVAADRLDMESQLRHAFQQNEFLLHYQLQFDMLSGDVIGVEALLRWQHAEKGIIFPKDFLCVAEEIGLIVDIGEWILREACRTIKKWQDTGFPALPLAISISSRQIRRRDFFEVLASTLVSVDFEPQFLEIEITEDLLMESPEEIMPTLHRLSHMGIRLSIDDFGTGYSSLAFLKQFPIKCLKIDQSFVAEIENDSAGRAIAFAAIALAHALDFKVVAKGVEKETQYQLLREHGCDEAQGTWFSEAQSADATFALLQSKKKAKMS